MGFDNNNEAGVAQALLRQSVYEGSESRWVGQRGQIGEEKRGFDVDDHGGVGGGATHEGDVELHLEDSTGKRQGRTYCNNWRCWRSVSLTMMVVGAGSSQGEGSGCWSVFSSCSDGVDSGSLITTSSCNEVRIAVKSARTLSGRIRT